MLAEPMTLYKLMNLYMLHQVNFPLTNAQLSNFFLDREYTTYFTLQQALNELLDAGLVKKETMRNSSRYEITKEGEETREKTTEALRALGFTVLDSKTNFIFAKSGDMPGKVYFDGLREAGILVRRWDSERIKDYVRISIGSEEEMETFVEETKKLVEAARSAVVR